jgi:hypothetical protein
MTKKTVLKHGFRLWGFVSLRPEISGLYVTKVDQVPGL